MLILIGVIILFLVLFGLVGYVIDYRILKNYHLKKQKWDLNICCGPTDNGRVNADIIRRKVPNFVLIENIYRLPFKKKQFKNTICSHTMEHVEDPDKFFKELRRVSENVVVLIPPVWDLVALGFLMEHKWQFLTFRTMHKNKLPQKCRLPYWWYHRRIGQRIK